MSTRKRKIAFVGGGTLGPVTPLLATLTVLQKQDKQISVIWFGTKEGPERALIPKGVTFYDIPVAKFPRYPSLQWLTFPFKYFSAHKRARMILEKERPDMIVGAGGFTQVPVMFAGFTLGIPSMIHQLDSEPGMSNRKVASKALAVSSSFAYKEPPFGVGVTSQQIATPVRFSKEALLSKVKAATHFGLDSARPIVLIMGGGTGALRINEAVASSLDALLMETQIIHSTGKGKKVTEARKGYFVTEFLADDLIQAYSAADLVISRAGMGSISECTALEKPMILIPIPQSHQEQNARRMVEGGGAELVQQDDDLEETLKKTIKRVLGRASLRKELVTQAKMILPTDHGQALAKVILKQS